MDVLRYIFTVLSIGVVVFELTEAGRYPRAAPKCPKLTGFNGRIKYRRRGTRAVFKCAKTETRYGPRYLTCQRDGTWNGEMPVCIKGGCVPVDVSQSPYLDMAEQYSGALLKFSCEASYQLLGATESYCDGHNWSNPLPTCKATTDLTECDFETDHCGWTQDDTDEGDWVRNAGPTSTGNTGPKYDHTFMDQAAGHYLFFEASNPATNGDQARLISPEYTADMSPMCFDFWYHLLGPDDQGHVGSLEVFVLGRSQFFDDLQPVFYKEGNQGDRWIRGEIIIDEMTEPYQIVIEATRKLSYISDIAIDDLRLFNCTDDATTTTATVKSSASMKPKPSTTVTKTTQGNTTSPFANMTASPVVTTRVVNITTAKIQPTTAEHSLTNISNNVTTTTLVPKPSTTQSPTNITVSKASTTARPVPSTTTAPVSTQAKTTLRVTNATTTAVPIVSTTLATKPSTASSTSAPTSKPPATTTTTVAVTSRPMSPSTTSATTTQKTRKPPTTATPTTLTTTRPTTVTKRTKATTPKPTNPTPKPTKPKTKPTTTKSTLTTQTMTVPTQTTFVYTESTTKQTTLRPHRTTQKIARTTAPMTKPTTKTTTERSTAKRTSATVTSASTVSSFRPQTKTPAKASTTASATKDTGKKSNLSTKSTQPTVSVGVMKASEHPKDDTLKPLMIGLGVGIVAGLIIIGVVAYVCIRRRKFYTSRYEDELKPITNSGSSQSINNVQYYDGDEEYES